MGKWTDKLYITQSEWASSFGGATATKNTSSQVNGASSSHLPFGCCNRSFVQLLGRTSSQKAQPVVDITTGLLYDRLALDPTESIDDKFRDVHWEKDPVTGGAMCPISRKVFTEFIPIVFLKPSGWLYSKDTITELNLNKKNFYDLMTGVSFTRGDIVQLLSRSISNSLPVYSQSPVKSISDKNTSSPSGGTKRQYVEPSTSMPITSSAKKPLEHTNKNASIARVIEALEKGSSTLRSECHRLGLEKMQLKFLSSTPISCPSEAPMPPKSVFNPPQSTKGTRGETAASLTSTAMTIVTKNVLLNDKSSEPSNHNKPATSKSSSNLSNAKKRICR